MRCVRIFIWLILVVSISQVSQAQNSTNHRSPVVSVKLASVSVSVEKIAYCQGDADIYTAELQLKLQFTNLGPSKLIVYKPRNPIEITGGGVAKDARDLEERRYETTLQYDMFVEPPNLAESERPDPNLFAIFDPQESYDLPAALALMVRSKSAHFIPGTIEAGDHTMIITVDDWPFATDAGNRLRAKWAHVGVLSYDHVASQPFVFSLSPAPELRKCALKKLPGAPR